MIIKYQQFAKANTFSPFLHIFPQDTSKSGFGDGQKWGWTPPPNMYDYINRKITNKSYILYLCVIDIEYYTIINLMLSLFWQTANCSFISQKFMLQMSQNVLHVVTRVVAGVAVCIHIVTRAMAGVTYSHTCYVRCHSMCIVLHIVTRVMSVATLPQYVYCVTYILMPEILGNHNINTGTTLLLKTIVN